MDEAQRAELERQMTRLAAAKEAEESARRQDKQDEGEQEKKKVDRKRRGMKEKERRNVYVNVEGVMTDPRGYERNKVRTSKYTLLSFVPKVRPSLTSPLAHVLSSHADLEPSTPCRT